MLIKSCKSLILKLGGTALVVATFAIATRISAQTTPPRISISLPNGANPIPKGPFKPTWESIKANYKTPQWFVDAKFGIMMHWGLYAVPAHQSEWYATHMYNNPEIIKWHTEHFGAPDKFGYKDFIPLFKAEKFDPDAWVALFKASGAKYIIPTAEHHDGFALWDSKLTKWDAMDMGPHRDLIGDLAKAARKQGLKFGVSNHRMENWSFMYPKDPNLKTDLFDPAYADFYGPPQPLQPGQDHMSGKGHPQSDAFLEEWLARNQELIDKYQPDILWFDNGINDRSLDPIKLRLAAYYYNRARQWKKDVSLSTKGEAYLAGTAKDYERQSRAPKEITDYLWEVDDPVLNRFGYTEGSPITSVKTVVDRLIENVSKNGGLLLNISPKADGTIPEDQHQLLLKIGKWLEINGEAIYGTHAWTKWSEGDKGEQQFRFTVKGDILYVFVSKWPGTQALVKSLALGPNARIQNIEILGSKSKILYIQDVTGLKVSMPVESHGDLPFVLKIKGMKL